MILLVPLVAIGALATARLVEGGARAVEADQVLALAAVSVDAAELGDQLHRERIEAVRRLSDPGGDTTGFNRQSGLTDEAVGSYQASRAELGRLPEVVEQRLAAIDAHVAELAALRQQVLGDPPVATSAAVLRYGAILADIGAYQDALPGAIEDPALSELTRAVAAMSQAAAHAADAEAIAQAAVTAGGLSEQQRETLRATQIGQQEAFAAFRQAATPAQRAIADRAITGANVAAAESATAVLLQDDSGGEAAAAGLAGMVDVTRFVQRQLLDQLLDSVAQTRTGVFQRVLVESGLVVTALLVAILVAVLLARMLATSLRRLRASAVAVAERELPEAVQRLSDPRTVAERSPSELASQVRVPEQLRSEDEIGEVAQALYAVHRAAVRTAAEQAALRTSVSAMFLNLARRSQTLVDHMITRLDRLQQNEQDDDKLAQMYALDNLATRMRRNDENLLVLAGADSSPPRTRDALIADVLQAAQSEIEHYQRIEFGTIDDDVSVVAAAINDVVRLLAELLDNATRFSRPESPVVCEARRLGDRLIVQIEDRGVGMARSDVEAINTHLARPGELDVTAFRRMGVAVVARLAARHRIHVTVQSRPHYGTTATVTLPPATLVLPASRQRAFALPAGRSPLPVSAMPATVPMPARQPGQLPRRSGEVVRHTASRRGPRPAHDQGSPPPEPAPAPATAADMPVAGRPAYPSAGHDQPQPTRTALPTIELPIFKETETAWFQAHGDNPVSGHGEQPRPAAPRLGNTDQPELRTAAAGGHRPTADVWKTAADHGWNAAAAAATPTAGGETRAGLPKRVPQAQLVPGGVETATQTATVPTQRRTPEQIRGLLSAYQRGVQRGRDTWT